MGPATDLPGSGTRCRLVIVGEQADRFYSHNHKVNGLCVLFHAVARASFRSRGGRETWPRVQARLNHRPMTTTRPNGSQWASQEAKSPDNGQLMIVSRVDLLDLRRPRGAQTRNFGDHSNCKLVLFRPRVSCCSSCWRLTAIVTGPCRSMGIDWAPLSQLCQLAAIQRSTSPDPA